MRLLPIQFWNRAATLLAWVEKQRRWPTNELLSLTTLLFKEGASGPGTGRPIVLLNLLYRLWAAARTPQVRH